MASFSDDQIELIVVDSDDDEQCPEDVEISEFGGSVRSEEEVFSNSDDEDVPMAQSRTNVLGELLKRKKIALRNVSNKRMFADACNDLGTYYHEQKRYRDALIEFELQAKVCKDLGLRMGWAACNRMIGEMYLAMAEFDKALEHVQCYLTIAKEQINPIEELKAMETLGRIHLVHGQSTSNEKARISLKAAEVAFTKSLLLCKNCNGKISQCRLIAMYAGLLLNLGDVQVHLGHLDKAIECIREAMTICSNEQLYEELHNCYTKEAYLHCDKKDYARALICSDEALKVASKLKDMVQKTCETLTLKALILCKMSEYQNAKKVLLKAWKMKTPNEVYHRHIESFLKVAVAMCKTWDLLISSEPTDHVTLKKLYEKLGDGAWLLKSRDLAVEYYTKALAQAEMAGDRGKTLAPIYASLYQTYKEMGRYEEALDYCKKEFEVIKDVPKDAFDTLYNIAEVLFLAKKPYHQFEKACLDARNVAKKWKNTKYEIWILKWLLQYQEKYGETDNMRDIKAELQALGHDSLESSEGEIMVVEGDGITTGIGDDVCLEELSDLSDTNEERVPETREARKEKKIYSIKRNSKEETKLHRACKQGNKQLVEALLAKGHPVNVRDHAGWSPLHVACKHGHLEIVNILINSGANIDDTGGTKCNGRTPLYDAATNGHLEVMELLLKNGAIPNLKTDIGDTPLQALQNWRAGRELTMDEEILYKYIFYKYHCTNTCLIENNDSVVHTTKLKTPVKPTNDISQPSTSRMSNLTQKSNSPMRENTIYKDNVDYDEIIQLQNNEIPTSDHTESSDDLSKLTEVELHTSREPLVTLNEDDNFFDKNMGANQHNKRKLNYPISVVAKRTLSENQKLENINILNESFLEKKRKKSVRDDIRDVSDNSSESQNKQHFGPKTIAIEPLANTYVCAVISDKTTANSSKELNDTNYKLRDSIRLRFKRQSVLLDPESRETDDEASSGSNKEVSRKNNWRRAPTRKSSEITNLDLNMGQNSSGSKEVSRKDNSPPKRNSSRHLSSDNTYNCLSTDQNNSGIEDISNKEKRRQTTTRKSSEITNQDLNMGQNNSDLSNTDEECVSETRETRNENKKYTIKRNSKGETKLHRACIKGKQLLVKTLLAKGHPVNVRDHAGWSPLHEACKHGHLEVARILINSGAYIDDMGGIKCNGRTPLYEAATYGHLEVMELLLKKGAIPNLKTDFGETPLQALQNWRDGRELLYKNICNTMDCFIENNESVAHTTKSKTPVKPTNVISMPSTSKMSNIIQIFNSPMRENIIYDDNVDYHDITELQNNENPTSDDTESSDDLSEFTEVELNTSRVSSVTLNEDVNFYDKNKGANEKNYKRKLSDPIVAKRPSSENRKVEKINNLNEYLLENKNNTKRKNSQCNDTEDASYNSSESQNFCPEIIAIEPSANTKVCFVRMSDKIMANSRTELNDTNNKLSDSIRLRYKRHSVLLDAESRTTNDELSSGSDKEVSRKHNRRQTPLRNSFGKTNQYSNVGQNNSGDDKEVSRKDKSRPKRKSSWHLSFDKTNNYLNMEQNNSGINDISSKENRRQTPTKKSSGTTNPDLKMGQNVSRSDKEISRKYYSLPTPSRKSSLHLSSDNTNNCFNTGQNNSEIEDISRNENRRQTPTRKPSRLLSSDIPIDGLNVVLNKDSSTKQPVNADQQLNTVQQLEKVPLVQIPITFKISNIIQKFYSPMRENIINKDNVDYEEITELQTYEKPTSDDTESSDDLSEFPEVEPNTSRVSSMTLNEDVSFFDKNTGANEKNNKRKLSDPIVVKIPLLENRKIEKINNLNDSLLDNKNNTKRKNSQCNDTEDASYNSSESQNFCPEIIAVEPLANTKVCFVRMSDKPIANSRTELNDTNNKLSDGMLSRYKRYSVLLDAESRKRNDDASSWSDKELSRKLNRRHTPLRKSSEITNPDLKMGQNKSGSDKEISRKDNSPPKRKSSWHLSFDNTNNCLSTDQNKSGIEDISSKKNRRQTSTRKSSEITNPDLKMGQNISKSDKEISRKDNSLPTPLRKSSLHLSSDNTNNNNNCFNTGQNNSEIEDISRNENRRQTPSRKPSRLLSSDIPIDDLNVVLNKDSSTKQPVNADQQLNTVQQLEKVPLVQSQITSKMSNIVQKFNPPMRENIINEDNVDYEEITELQNNENPTSDDTESSDDLSEFPEVELNTSRILEYHQ